MSLLGNQEQRALDKSKVCVVILQKILFSSRRCQVFFLEVTTCSCYREPAMTSNNMPLSSARCSTRASGGWPTLSMILRGKNVYLRDKPMFFRVITWQGKYAGHLNCEIQALPTSKRCNEIQARPTNKWRSKIQALSTNKRWTMKMS